MASAIRRFRVGRGSRSFRGQMTSFVPVTQVYPIKS